jgi:pimeloyl-ACP methyl ester carboxylesterase
MAGWAAGDRAGLSASPAVVPAAREPFRLLRNGYQCEVAPAWNFPCSGGVKHQDERMEPLEDSQTIAGDWQGTFGEKKRRLVMRIAADDNGGWKATFHPIDQTAQPILIDSVVLDGHSLKLAINAIQGAYEGTISADGESIAGTWTQGKSMPLELLRATKESAWLAAPTPYRVEFIEVEAGVKLEVVDWGGSGRPLVLLAGLGATAHTYGKLAARLTPSFHVYGITRRGFGASTVPVSGYSADRLGDDVLAVLDGLNLDRPVLVGSSIAGQELSSVGSRYPHRVAGLVYLDAAYSYAFYDSSLGDLHIELAETRRKLEELQSNVLQDTRPLIQDLLESHLPRLERVLRERRKDLQATPTALLAAYAQAKIQVPPAFTAIHAGRQKYTHIPVPILAIYAIPPNFADLPGDPAERTSFEARTAVTLEAQAKAFEAGVPSARVVRLPYAKHEVFSSNEEDILREMNVFIGNLP